MMPGARPIGRVRGFTESAAIYLPSGLVTMDLNYIPSSVYPVLNAQEVGCYINRGDKNAMFEISALGRISNQAGYALIDPVYAPWLQSGAYLKIAKTGEIFRIMNIPTVHTQIPRLAHVRCLLDLQLAPVPGMGRIFFDSTYSSAVMAGSCIDTYIPA